MSTSGRAIFDALAERETDPERLEGRVRTRIRASRADVVEALRGRMADHQRLSLRIHLGQADAIDAAIAEIDADLGDRLKAFRDVATRLTTIPGASTLSATVIVAKVGTDMSRFPSDAHLISWAGLCPKSDESAGKRRSTKLRKGAPWLKTLLVQTD